MTIQLKRVYEAPSKSDGTRILVDRLWPRGLTKERAHVDLWLKEVAPSTELRKWFAHDPAKWSEFKKRYHAELDANPAAIAELRAAMVDRVAGDVFHYPYLWLSDHKRGVDNPKNRPPSLRA